MSDVMITHSNSIRPRFKQIQMDILDLLALGVIPERIALRLGMTQGAVNYWISVCRMEVGIMRKGWEGTYRLLEWMSNNGWDVKEFGQTRPAYLGGTWDEFRSQLCEG